MTMQKNELKEILQELRELRQQQPRRSLGCGYTVRINSIENLLFCIRQRELMLDDFNSVNDSYDTIDQAQQQCLMLNLKYGDIFCVGPVV